MELVASVARMQHRIAARHRRGRLLLLLRRELTALTPGQWFGIALVAGYVVWLFVFFQYLRPRAMRTVAGRLRTKVVESTDVLDAGTWSTDDDAPLAKTGAVFGADFVLLLLGTVGVAALVFIPAFIVAESGVLLPLESRMTGRGVTISLHAPNAMPADNPKVSLAIEVDNGGRADLRACRALVDGYSARNGYLHGASPWFDLAAGARVAAVVKLEAMRPPRGEHDVRIKVECDNERLAVGAVTLTVR